MINHALKTYLHLLNLYINLKKTWMFSSSLLYKLLYYCPQFLTPSLWCWCSSTIFSLFFNIHGSSICPFLVWIVVCRGGESGDAGIMTFRREKFVSFIRCFSVVTRSHSNFANILEKKVIKFYFQEQKTLRNSVWKPKRIVYTEWSWNLIYHWY